MASALLLLACGESEDPGSSTNNVDKSPSSRGDEDEDDEVSDEDDPSPDSPSDDEATGGDGDGDSSTWCKVKAVFDEHCTPCHDGEGTSGTPMGLTSYADLTADSERYKGKKIYERVGVRIHDTKKPMPPQGEISAADLALLDSWIAAKAPGSAADKCEPPTTEEPGPVVEEWPADCEEKYKLLANDGKGGPFTVRAGAQFYQDFLFDTPWSGDVQGVAFKPVVGNKKVLHHYIVYDGSDAFLSGWSPGKQESPLPEDVGVFLPGNDTLKMTVHYYNAVSGAKAEEDASGVEICITKRKRPKVAAVMPFAANPVVPPGGAERSSTCTVRASEPIHIITSSPHMHGLGVHAKLVVQRANGTTEVIHDKPFNFEEQRTYPIDFVVNNGDKITTTCKYENTGSSVVLFGKKTEDEMCFNFALYYPMCGMTCAQSDPAAELYAQNQGGGCPGQ